MNRVLYALIPSMIFAIFLFGWRVLAVVLAANAAGYITEYLFIYKKKAGKVSMACFVTSTLVAMTLPPTIPIWMSAVGAIIAIAFGKMVFGGFGTNPFNPAILGRTFVYVSFPQQMTVNWIKPFTMSDFPGGFLRWSGGSEMITSATILGQFRLGRPVDTSFLNAFLGYISGSIGETSALLLILAGLYLIVSKTAKWQPMVSTAVSILLFNWIFYPAENPLFMLVTGGAMFGIVFMTTDPVSQAKGKYAIWIYGIMIGFLTVFIRRFSLFAEGFMFALLLTNAFMPIIEYGIDNYLLKPKKKVA
ncbi:MAG TPA: RnfABCDGE type electron transport complex subunit D [Candidatus Cloacimonadota bacterium]|nr:RnfABCDGE type electron transport complex subunit D [Candidatus Cloacimonadota bacterium]HPS37793.1 RnfABCDGE type electron transport complex subunit D [Candidatus Cloacimonadota bacterium]